MGPERTGGPVSAARHWVRAAAASLTVVVGAFFAYALAAGYFAALALPTPWNVLAGLAILAASVLVAERLTRRR